MGRPCGTPILVEVKRTNSMRDVRGALVALAYLVHGERSTSKAVCVLVDSRLSHGRLQEELQRLRGVLHPAIANRIDFLVDKGAPSHNVVAFSGSLEDVSNDFYTWLEELVATERLRGHTPQLPPRQIVVATLAQLRLLEPTTSDGQASAGNMRRELPDRGDRAQGTHRQGLAGRL